jgi:ABC-type lipoprotein export system ATPase subunit
MSDPGWTILRVCGVHKSFPVAGGSTVALQGVDLDIEAGSFASIVGPSGCGKSTLLQIMAGLATPTARGERGRGALVTPSTTGTLDQIGIDTKSHRNRNNIRPPGIVPFGSPISPCV